MEEGRKLSIIHFNDVYDIQSRKVEPVGGVRQNKVLIVEPHDLRRLLVLPLLSRMSPHRTDR